MPDPMDPNSQLPNDPTIDPTDAKQTLPWWAKGLKTYSSIGIAQQTLVSSFRGSSTIMRGGWDNSLNGTFAGNKQWFQPWRAEFRFSNTHMYDENNMSHWPHALQKEVAGLAEDPMVEGYYPFNMAQMGNRLGNFALKRGMGSEDGAILGSEANYVMADGTVKTVANPMFAGGFIGRISAASKVRGSATVPENVMNYLRTSSTPVSNAIDGLGTPLTGAGASDAIMASIPGTISGRAAGYIAGARGLSAEGRVIAEQAGSDAFKAGLSVAERQVARKAEVAAAGGLRNFATEQGVRAAASAGVDLGSVAAVDAVAMWLPGIDVIAAAWTAYELSKAGGQMIKGVAQAGLHTASDAFKSFQGGLTKPVFGAGFTDSAATITSRQRGVMAIQNSQLNARNVIGNEAGMMYNHFG